MDLSGLLFHFVFVLIFRLQIPQISGRAEDADHATLSHRADPFASVEAQPFSARTAVSEDHMHFVGWVAHAPAIHTLCGFYAAVCVHLFVYFGGLLRHGSRVVSLTEQRPRLPRMC